MFAEIVCCIGVDLVSCDALGKCGEGERVTELWSPHKQQTNKQKRIGKQINNTIINNKFDLTQI